MRNLLLIAIASLSLLGCATSYLLRPGELPPVTTTIASDQRVATWQRAIAVLLDEGYVPQVLNEAACYVSAKQRDDVTVGALAGTIAIVTVSPEGLVRVEVGGSGLYHSQADLRRDVEAEQRKLLAAIAARAPMASR